MHDAPPAFIRDLDSGCLSIRYDALRGTYCITSSAPYIDFDAEDFRNYCRSTTWQSLHVARRREILRHVRERVNARESCSHDCLALYSSGHLPHVQLSSASGRWQLDSWIGKVNKLVDLRNPLYALEYSEEQIRQRLGQFGRTDTDSCSPNRVLSGLLIVDHVRKCGAPPYECELTFQVRNNLCSHENTIQKITQIGVRHSQVASFAGRLGLEAPGTEI